MRPIAGKICGRPAGQGGARLTLAIEATPTRRFGPTAQGADIHHNPTLGPAGSPDIYGHVFVVLGRLVTLEGVLTDRVIFLTWMKPETRRTRPRKTSLSFS